MNQNQSNTLSILDGLTHEQASAVLHSDGPLLVLAGAGSGKTRVLTHRVIHLLNERDIEHNRIMAVTFTNKAAKEMKSRIQKLSGGNQKALDQMWIGTFHGICNRLLRLEIPLIEMKDARGKTLTWSRNFVIFDSQDSLSLLKECLKALNLDEKLYPPKMIQGQISTLKNLSVTSAQFSARAKDSYETKIAEIYDKYQEKLQINNALDFDDLLLFTLELFRTNQDRLRHYNNRFAHLLVDEFQDTNQTQYDLLKTIVLGTSSVLGNEKQDWHERSFCAVGDIDQSIYSWRGANYKLTLNFQKDYSNASIIKLEHNYRSKEQILVVANSIIKNNQQRIEKNLICTRGQGEKITCFEASDEVEEGNFVAAEIKKLKDKGTSVKEIAVLYRTNAQSRALEESLIKTRIPYRIVGGMRFYDRLEIKDLIAYLRLIFNSKDSNSLKRVINSPRRGIGPSTISLIEEKANAMGMSLYASLSDLLDSGSLGAKATQSAHSFVELIDDFIRLSQEVPVPDLLRAVIERSGYLLALEAQDDDEAEGRIENIYELINVAQQFQEESEDKSLEAFLAQISLVGDADSIKDEDEAVTLLTVHSSKGLEFPYVFITGLEEGVFPHTRALTNTKDSNEELEEERRLLYVAITRAEDKLYITYARRRRLWGQREYAEPSRFIAEMPPECLVGYWGSSVIGQSSNKYATGQGSSKYSVPSAPVNKFNSSTRESNRVQDNVEAAPKFQEGDRVTHKTFGMGKVLSLFGDKKQKFYSVQFDNADGKKLLSGDSLHKV